LDCIINSSISIKSIIKILIQVFQEKIHKQFKKRRSLIQPQLSFDLYCKNLKKYKPQFSTFFTNHIAGMMHYYWFDVFPNDFKKSQREINLFNKKSVIKALDIADKQIGSLMKFAKENSYELWVASSMGQKAIERKKSHRLFIRDFSKTLNFLQLKKKNYKLLPSMYPDINIESDSEEKTNQLINEFLELKFLNNEKLFNVRYRKNNNKVNLIYGTNPKRENFFIYKNKKFHFSALGLDYGSEQIGTGYHCPNGILLTNGEKSSNIFKNKDSIDTKMIFSKILEFFAK
jgi:hypothetical protein